MLYDGLKMMFNKRADWRKIVFPTVGALTGAAIGAGVPRLFLPEEKKNLGSLLGAAVGGILGGGGGYFLSKIPTQRELELQRHAARLQQLQALIENRRQHLKLLASPIYAT